MDGTDLAGLKADKGRLEDKVRALEKQVAGMREELEDARSEVRIAQQQAGGGGGMGMFGGQGEVSTDASSSARDGERGWCADKFFSVESSRHGMGTRRPSCWILRIR